MPTEPRALYYLTEPKHMLAGEVRPPSCYLDAIDILRRQYLAYIIDCTASGSIPTPPMPQKMGLAVPRGLDHGGWMHAVVQASQLDPTTHSNAFAALFGDAITGHTRDLLADFAANGIAEQVKLAFGRWEAQLNDLGNQRKRLKNAIDAIDALPRKTQDDDNNRSQFAGERAAVSRQIDVMRDEYVLSGLERLGLLPNYTLIGDTVQLDASLWSRDKAGNYQSVLHEYRRGTAMAIREFAPGNSFYASGHRLVIDGLDIGGTGDDEEVQWRLCPQCGYGAPEITQASWAQCPRCNYGDIHDLGARHSILTLSKVSTVDSEEATRVYDDTDERERELFDIVTTVDIDPADIAAAYEHDTETFGVELARTAVLRTVNLGKMRGAVSSVVICGPEHKATRFRTCIHCGIVDGARRRRSGDPVHHRGWCYTKTGNKKEEWRDLILMHELRTEAIRMLMPVSTFEDSERLASFKGALMLGLRLDFGGEPDHLAVVASDYPGSGGPGRRRFLVIHDLVPGGTGYLGRLADPVRLYEILDKARLFIARCECQHEGRQACHRCLLSGVAPSEIALVSRQFALEVLDQLLAEWSFHPVATVADIDISRVEQSELERRFAKLLLDWGANQHTDGSAKPTALAGGRTGIELRLSDGSQQVSRWLVTEQKQVGGAFHTMPDFLFQRQDGPPLDVAVYLDGYQFHASPEHNRIADDAQKRRSLRTQGAVVWNVTWNDVDLFGAALQKEIAATPMDRQLLSESQRNIAQMLVSRGPAYDGFDARWVQFNSVRLLLEFLRHPDDRWGLLARGAIAGVAVPAAQAPPIHRYSPDDMAIAIRSALGAGPPANTDDAAPIVGATAHSLNGLSVTTFIDSRDEYADGVGPRMLAIAVLDDSAPALAEPGHQQRWADWLQWSNLLQFARSPVAEHVIAASSEAKALDIDGLTMVPGGFAAYTEEIGIDDDADMELLTDPAVLGLVRRARAAGSSGLAVGYEIDDEGELPPIEAAWPSARVGVVVGLDAADINAIRSRGWNVRDVDDWTLGELLTAIGKGH